VPALSALLFGAFAFIAGTNTLNEAPMWYQGIVAFVVIVAFVTLAWGTYEFYKAAYGHTQNLDINLEPPHDLADCVMERQLELADESLGYMRRALRFTAGGMALMIIVFLLALFAPKGGDPRAVMLTSMDDELVFIEKLIDRFDVLSTRLKQKQQNCKEKQLKITQAIQDLNDFFERKIEQAKDFVIVGQ
jgi:hypothetical protein